MDGEKIKEAGSSAKSWAKSILSGDILLRMRLDRLFPYILYAFVLGWLSIWMSYKMEQTMSVAVGIKIFNHLILKCRVYPGLSMWTLCHHKSH